MASEEKPPLHRLEQGVLFARGAFIAVLLAAVPLLLLWGWLGRDPFGVGFWLMLTGVIYRGPCREVTGGE